MNKAWWFVFGVVALTFLMAQFSPKPGSHSVISVSWQAATPEADETEAMATDALPRPPSEAGQNMVLILGAAILVLIVFIGVAIHARHARQNVVDDH